ncbi:MULTISPECIES: hypothetical protein [unclassified Modicisalibacter]|uniref:hypothetical protein n=1 Tax=unclassified Modicisalibacter TaxID=2679913 RepID=UPI001CCDF222|nr:MULTISPECIES: hypothetical protein [unclassified Modicisalibacter]MBZ9559081.1 hypothetical protein [Modicisalibacter sp. R2A 31.J]MBZ9576808.1 hypothetical protein [Modicisalibacter sp. MOD 31.J]
MKHRTKSSRTARAAGSVMDIWPTGSYSQHMPKGSDQERLSQYWASVGKHLRSALSQYDIDHASRR